MFDFKRLHFKLIKSAALYLIQDCKFYRNKTVKFTSNNSKRTMLNYIDQI